MAIEQINLGTEPLGTGGDTARTAFDKVNANFSELDQRAGANASDLADLTQTVGTIGGNLEGLGQAVGELTDEVVALDNRTNQVDNTSDADKPVSTAQQQALDARLKRAENLADLPDTEAARENIGLGNVPNYPAANQAEGLAGTAPDRLMTAQRVGEFVRQYGLGESRILTDSQAQGTTAPGFYYVTGMAGTPLGAPTSGYLLVNRFGANGNYSTHLFFPFTVDRAFLRRRDNGAWQPWQEFLHTGNSLALGTTPAAARTALGLGSLATYDAGATETLEALGADDAENLTKGVLPDGRVSSTLPADKAYRRGNILGVVSQLGGVPSGALIERGSNANGTYVRFADGTQICWSDSVASVDCTQANGSLFIGSSSVTWTFPAAFAVGPQIAPGSAGSSTGLRWVTAGVSSPTAAVLRVMSPSSSGVALPIGALAIGRWF